MTVLLHEKTLRHSMQLANQTKIEIQEQLKLVDKEIEELGGNPPLKLRMRKKALESFLKPH